MDETNLDTLLTKAYQAAPTHIQRFIDRRGVSAFASKLQARSGLHVDVADQVADQILLTLLGVLEPAELMGALRDEVKLTDAQIQDILAQANAEIFTPLQEELRKGGREEAVDTTIGTQFDPLQELPPELEARLSSLPDTQSVSAGPSPQPSTRREAAPPPSYTPPTPPPAPTFPLYDMGSENTREVTPPIPTYNTGTPVSIPTPVAQAVAPVPPPQTPIPQTPTPTAEERPLMRTFASDVEQLKHGETPHAYAQGSAPRFAPAPVATPMPSLTERPVVPPPPVTPTPTSAAPVATPTFVMPPQTPIERPRTPTPTKEEVTHSLKQYGIDPYREPVE